jgi:rubrerythrin
MTNGGGIKPERSVEELLAYARLMERAAAERYTELADIMTAHNNREVAEFFRRMAEIEWIHVYNVGELARELEVPDDNVQPGSGDRLRGAEIPDLDDVHYLERPHHAIAHAYGYEQNAARFFRELAESAKTEQLRAAALRLAAEEEMHMRELERWLVRYPKPEAGWDDDPDPVNAQD